MHVTPLDNGGQSWPTERIGTLFDIGAGKSVTPVSRYGEPKFPFLRTSNVFWGYIDLSDIDAMHFTPEEIETKSLKSGDLLVCEGGDIGRSAIWNGELPQCSFQNHLHRLRPKRDGVVPHFFMYYLQAGFTQLGIYEGAGNKTTIPNLSRSRLASLDVPLPPPPEQQKIAAVLWKLQRAIATQDRLLAATAALKQSAMQRLFTHGLKGEPLKDTEIGPVPESWPFVRLGNAYDTQLGKMLSQKAHVGDSPKLYLRNKNVQWGILDLSDLLKMDFSDREAEKFKLTPGDLLVCEGGVIGRAAIWRGELQDCYYQKAIHRVRPKGDSALNEFLCYWLSFAFEHQNLYNIGGASSTIAHLPQTLLEGLKIPIPGVDEQRSIATALATLDSKLAHHRAKRAALHDLFETLLHQLMTAEIRVADLDIDTSEVTDHFADAGKMIEHDATGTSH